MKEKTKHLKFGKYDQIRQENTSEMTKSPLYWQLVNGKKMEKMKKK